MKKESAEYGVDVTNEATAPVKGVTLAQPVVRGDETITYVEIGDAIRQSGNQAHCADCRCQTCSI